MLSRPKRAFGWLGFFAAAGLFPATGFAADGVWIRTTSGGLWSTTANWASATVADGAGFTADFTTLNPAADLTVRLDSARTLGALRFGDTTPSSPGAWLLDDNGDPANVLTLAGASPSLAVDALGTGKSATLAVGLAGTSGFTKSGAGTLALAAANPLSGNVSVSAGALQLRHPSALASATGLTLANATALHLRADADTSFAGPVLSPAATANAAITFDVAPLAAGAAPALTLAGGLGLAYPGSTTHVFNVTGPGDARLVIPTLSLANTGTSGNSQTRARFNPTTANLTLGNFTTTALAAARDVYLILDGTSTGNRITGRIANITTGVAWTFLTKQGSGTWTISTATNSNFAGTAAINAGVLNVQVNNALGNTNRGTSVADGATLQLESAGTLNYSTAEALTLRGQGVASAGALRSIAGANTFAGLLTLAADSRINCDAGSLHLSHVGTVASSPTTTLFALTVGGAGDTRITSVLGATVGSLTKDGAGTLTLAGLNSYAGSTDIRAGTLALAASGRLPADSALLLAAGATLDVSALADADLASPGNAVFSASGSTDGPALLRGGDTVDLGVRPVTLAFAPAGVLGDDTRPALRVASGVLGLSGPLTVINDGPAPLGAGVYTLVTQDSGALTGSPGFGGSVGGLGLIPGGSARVRLNGAKLELVVEAPVNTTTTLARAPGTGTATIYGTALSFVASVSPSTASGTVELRRGGSSGALLGSGPLIGGSATITLADTALAVGAYSDLVASYPGVPLYLPSVSAALAPAQTINPKALTATWSVGNKLFDGSTSANVQGVLAGVEAGDSVTLNASGVFASAAVGNGIAVTSTSILGGVSASNYTLTPPSGLSANILASFIWTGGSSGAGTDFAQGTNYSPAANTANGFDAVFNGSDPSTTDLTLASTVGGAVGTNGSLLGVAGNQTTPVTLTGLTGATYRSAGVTVHSGAGAVTLRGTLAFVVGGTSTPTTHEFANHSANPLLFDTGVNFNSGNNLLRTLNFGGAGPVTVNGNLAPSTASRMAVTKTGAGVLTLAGANTFSGGATFQAGEVVAATSGALGGGNVVNHATLNLTARNVTYTGLSSALSGTGTVNVTLGTGTGSTTLNGNYAGFTGTWNVGVGAAAGAGKAQMNGADNASATIRVLQHGTLYTTSGTHQAALFLHGGDTGESLGQLRIEGTATWAGPITLAGEITGDADGTVGGSSGTPVISGAIGETGGARSLSKIGSGTLTLSGQNTYTGPTTVRAGTLLVNTPGSLAAASAVRVEGGGSLGGTGVVNGAVTVATGGTLRGPLAIAGPVVVEAGGTLDASDPAVASPAITGTLSLAGTLRLSVSRTRVPAASAFSIPGTFNRTGGTLEVVNVGPDLVAGDSFTVSIGAGGVVGSFAGFRLPALAYGLTWDTSQFASTGVLAVIPHVGFPVSTITLNPTTVHQQIHGMGANFCLGPQGIAWNTSQFNQIFSPTGLNISFVRLANSFECELDEPQIFWRLWHSDNARFIRMFRALQPEGLITMSAWSPPAYLKSTGSAQGGTLAKSGSAYRYADYGDWWLRSLQDLRDNNPTLPVEEAIPDFISIQNETDFTPSGTFYAAWQAGNYLNATETSTRAGYPQALAAVKSAFAANGFGFVKFIGPDTTTASPSVISSYLNNLPSDAFAAIAHHPYQGSTNNVGNNTSSLSGLRAAYPNATIYMTEFFGDDSYGEGIPGWMMHALPMHAVFTIEQANTYLMWGLSLSATSDSFCALGHYSKFIRPNDWRIAATSSDPNVVVSLYRHPVTTGLPDQLILVLTNKSASYGYPTIRTSAHWAADPARRSWKVYKTANDGSTQQRLSLVENVAGATLAGDRNLVVAPYSMTTVVINSDAPPSALESWRIQYFGTGSPLGDAADLADPNGDGESNLLEFATGQDPLAATTRTPALEAFPAEGLLELTYTRSKAALSAGHVFVVEWSDTLEAGSWAATGVTTTILTDDGVTQSVLASVPTADAPRRFLRLRVTAP